MELSLFIIMNKNFWYVVLVVVFGIIPGWIFYKTETAISSFQIEPVAPFAAQAVPDGYKTLNSLEGKGGKLYEFYNPTNFTKYSLLISALNVSNTALPSSPKEVLKTLTDRQQNNFINQPSLADFTQAYLGSAFDPMRAYDIAVLDGEIPVVKFITTKGANYALGAWRSKLGSEDIEVAILAMKKNDEVSSAGLSAFVSTLKPELKPASSNSSESKTF